MSNPWGRNVVDQWADIYRRARPDLRPGILAAAESWLSISSIYKLKKILGLSTGHVGKPKHIAPGRCVARGN